MTTPGHHGKKICLVASSGGHLAEIKALKKVIEQYDCVLVTEREDYQVSCYNKEICLIDKMNRHQLSSLVAIFPAIRNARHFLDTQRITHLITTGAMCCVPYCIAAKSLHIKVIYIESYARVKSPSLTGRIVYPIADLFIVQWRGALRFFPKAVYGGGIF